LADIPRNFRAFRLFAEIVPNSKASGGDAELRNGGTFMRRGILMIFAVVSLALCGCGASPGCRAVSTGALGAGTGAAIAAIAGGPVGLAAAIGGASGAVASAATPPGAAYLGPSPFCY
jgi:hypothetical protein